MSKQFPRKKGSNKRSKGSMDASSMRGNGTPKENMPCVITSGENNDPEWYKHIYTVAEDVARVPFSYPSGIHFDPLTHRDSGLTRTLEPSNLSLAFPGIMVFDLMPTIGPTQDATDPANVAAQQIYSIMRQANAGAKNYDPGDVMMLIQAMDSPYMLYNELVRAYRLYDSYDPMNRYQPDALITALGFSPNLVADRANFRTLLDTFAYRLAAINIPDQFDFIKRHSWLYSNVYTDSERVSKAQMYAYRPDGFYVWTEGVNDEPTKLVYTSRKSLYGYSGAVVETLDQIKHAIDTLTVPLLGSGDVGIISGDLAKAFGDGGMIKIAPVSDHMSLYPVYSEEVVNQMMNASIMSASPKTVPGVGDNSISLDYSNLTAGPLLKQIITLESNVHTELQPMVKHLLNYVHAEPSVDNVLVSTRLITLGTNDARTTSFRVSSCGSEIVTHAYVYYNEPNSSSMGEFTLADLEVFQYHSFAYQDGQTSANLVNFIETCLLTSKFDYAPTMYVSDPADATRLIFEGVIQDVNTYTWLDDQTIEKLNDACLLSLYYVKDWKTLLSR